MSLAGDRIFSEAPQENLMPLLQRLIMLRISTNITQETFVQLIHNLLSNNLFYMNFKKN